jgi:hypothetical protein
MNIQIFSSRLIAAFVIGVLWVMTSIVAVSSTNYTYGTWGLLTLVLLFFVGWATTYGVLSVLHNLESNNNQSKVDRMLSQLDERDLEVLRRRLSPRQRDYYEDGEYESLEDLLDQQKQKRG